MTVSRPSRPNSAMSAQTLLVPMSSATSVPWATADLCCSPGWSLDVVPPDEGDVVEDAKPEGDEGHEVQVDAEAVADEGEDDRDDRVGHEARDEDPVVVHPVELRPNRPEHRVQGSEDGDGRIAAELEADVDVEDEAQQDTHEEACQRDDHRTEPALTTVRSGKGYLTAIGRDNRISHGQCA